MTFVNSDMSRFVTKNFIEQKPIGFLQQHRIEPNQTTRRPGKTKRAAQSLAKLNGDPVL
jgi:hypothetical protein